MHHTRHARPKRYGHPCTAKISRYEATGGCGTCTWSCVVQIEDLPIKSIRRRFGTKPEVNIGNGRGLKLWTGNKHLFDLWDKRSNTLGIEEEEQFVPSDRSSE